MQVKAPASDWSVPIKAAKYFIRTKWYQSFYQYLKRSHEQIWVNVPLMIIAGTRWSVRSVWFSKACVLHQRVTALLPPSPLSVMSRDWLCGGARGSIHYTSSPIFGRCRAAQRLSRLAEPCLPASAPPSHLHLIHTGTSPAETAEASTEGSRSASFLAFVCVWSFSQDAWSELFTLGVVGIYKGMVFLNMVFWIWRLWQI